MRFRKKGWDIRFVPHAPVIHHKGVCSRSRPLFVEWHKHKGMLRFYNKHFRHQYPPLLMAVVAAGVWTRFGAVASRHLAGRARRQLAALPGAMARRRLDARAGAHLPQRAAAVTRPVTG
jgi:GT2 family glycosyltransferase